MIPAPVRRVLGWLYVACAVLAALFMAAIAVLILAQTLGRLVGVVVPDANELAGFCFAALTFLGLAPTLRSGGHIRVQLLISHLPPVLHRWLEVWTLAVAALLSGFFAWWAVDLAVGSWLYNDLSLGVLALPLWIPQSGMAFGLIVMTLCLLEVLVDVVGGRPPPYEGHEGEVSE